MWRVTVLTRVPVAQARLQAQRKLLEQQRAVPRDGVATELAVGVKVDRQVRMRTHRLTSESGTLKAKLAPS